MSTSRSQLVRCAAAFVICGFAASGQTNPAVGLWKNVEPDKTVLIRTTEQNGTLTGKVEKVFRKGVEDKASKCTKCEGDNKDKPVVSMTIIWGMKRDGQKWSGGKILEPDTGKVYNCKIEPIEGGKKLNVRGSIAFLGKTQTWTREE